MPLYFATETAKCSQIRAVCYPLQSEVSAHAGKPLISTELIMPGPARWMLTQGEACE